MDLGITVDIFVYKINPLDFITWTGYVYCEVRDESLNTTQVNVSL